MNNPLHPENRTTIQVAKLKNEKNPEDDVPPKIQFLLRMHHGRENHTPEFTQK